MDTSSLEKTDTDICETQWRHSVKTRLYNTPSPILHLMKRSDVTRWKQGYIRLASSVKTKEVKVIECHRIEPTWLSMSSTSQNFTTSQATTYLNKLVFLYK